jgi:hypothetical protein
MRSRPGSAPAEAQRYVGLDGSGRETAVEIHVHIIIPFFTACSYEISTCFSIT